MANAAFDKLHYGDRLLEMQLRYTKETGICPICKIREVYIHTDRGVMPTCRDYVCFLSFGYGFGHVPAGYHINKTHIPLNKDGKPYDF